MLSRLWSRKPVRLALESLEDRVVPANVNWAVDADGLWDIASNWVDDQGVHRVPGFNDDVFLDRAAGAFTITHAQGSDTIHSIHASASSLVLSGGNLDVRSTSNLDASLTVSGGYLGVEGPLDLNGSTQWTAGTIDHDGPLTNNGTFTLSGPDIKLLQGTLVNNATIVQTDSGDLHIGAFAGLRNESTGLYDLQSDANIIGEGGFTGTFTNLGTLLKSEGTETSWVPAVANQGGTVDVESGTLGLGGAGKAHINGGTFIEAAGAVLDLTSGYSNGSYSGTYTGYGDGIIRLDSGTFQVAGSSSVTLNFPDGMFQWTGGTIAADIFSSFITSNGVIDLDGASDKTLSGNLFNNGTINVNGTGGFQISTFGTLTNQDVGVFSLESDASVLGGGTFQNIGYFVKAGGTASEAWQPTFNNSGTWELDTGTLGFTRDVTQTGGTLLLAGGGLVVPNLNIQAGYLTGSGLIIGNVQNGGEIDIGDSVTAATLTITGNYTQTATGVLLIKLGAVEQGEYDQLQVGGRTTLAGTLSVVLLDDFYAQAGDSVQALTFASHSGDFQVTNLPDVSPLTLVKSFTETSLTLSFV
jgi:hypothetical protein